jgi:myogenesis-regulating glycosidase
MRCYKALFGSVVLCVALLTISPVYGQVTAFHAYDDDTAVTAKFGGYSVEIDKEPYNLMVRRGDRIIAQSEPGNWTRFQRDGHHKLTDVQGWSKGVDGISFKVGTTVDDLTAQVVLTFFPDNVQVRWTLSDEQPSKHMGQHFLLEPGEHWYGGDVVSGHVWPQETGEIEKMPFKSASNQTSPIWLTSAGAGYFVPTYKVMGYRINKDGNGLFTFHVEDTDAVEYRILLGETIVDAYDAFIGQVGKPAVVPPKTYFSKAIFNTWIEYGINVNQQDVEEYARILRENDYPCEIVMIDDRWQNSYGEHIFDAKKFPNPKAMMDKIHDMGFKLMLWDVPFVNANSPIFDELHSKKWLVHNADGSPGMCRWWNGDASLIDLSHPDAFDWYVGALKKLQVDYGVDGYKLDGGDANFCPPDFKSFGNITPNKYTDLFAETGTHFAINEFRVSWLMQQTGLVQRLRDKNNNWSATSGLKACVPHGLTESLIGYAYFSPDMIGGGLDKDFNSAEYKGMDPELFVRWTQASALMPMMQFSYAPWNLDEKSNAICLKYTKLHEQLGDYIYSLALDVKETGRPILRPLFFRNPEDPQAYLIDDQYLLGDRFLVAPVMTQGATSRDVYLLAGTWKDFWSGTLYKGPQTLRNYPAPIETMPIFMSVE